VIEPVKQENGEFAPTKLQSQLFTTFDLIGVVQVLTVHCASQSSFLLILASTTACDF
jgi:hypothetical protein